MCTHHDIITGTCYYFNYFKFFLAKKYVIDYYIKLLNET